MPLRLIVGPPNSGRAGELRERIEAAIGADPVLVVPTIADEERFEAELAGGGAPGAAIVRFGGLFDLVAAATGTVSPPHLTRAQRRLLVRRTIDDSEAVAGIASAASPGFAAAIESLFNEVGDAGLGPPELEEAASASGEAHLRRLATLHSEVCRRRDALGLGDRQLSAATATEALRHRPEAWGERPVFLYAFDDLAGAQLELLGLLARTAEVTVAVTYADRPALAARARLLEELRRRGGTIEVDRRERPAAYTASEVLRHLERGLFAEDPPSLAPDPGDRGLTFLDGAGERGAAEQVGLEIGRLLAGGVDPERIAIALRDPAGQGPLIASVLAGLGVPATVDAEVPAAATGVGRAVTALARAALGAGEPADLIAFMRASGFVPARTADSFELHARRRRATEVERALAGWKGETPSELEELRRAAGPEALRILARVARRAPAYPLRRRGALPEGHRDLELRAGFAIATELEALAEVPELLDDPGDDAVAAIEAVTIPLSQGQAPGRIRVTSPERLRAGGVTHLFVHALQEGEFPRQGPRDPLLSDEQRTELGLPPLAEPRDEERYLFYVAASRPTEALYLCWRHCEQDGSAASPSPFLDDVRDLLAPVAEPAGGGPTNAEPANGQPPHAERTARRELDRVVPEPGEATTAAGLARGLAARASDGRIADADGAAIAAVTAGLEAPGELVLEIGANLERAAERAARLPGPLSNEDVLAELAERREFGASTLEGFRECSFRWFVSHELKPRPLGPDPEPLLGGGMAHEVLARLYAEQPGGEELPSPRTVERWIERAAELVRQVADERAEDGDLRIDHPRARAMLARIEGLVAAFLRREASSAAERRLLPDPELLEASIAVRLPRAGGTATFLLHGQIDRIDRGPDGAAAIVDYKTSRQVTAAAKLEEEGKLQPQLYAIAAAQTWDLEPVAALYHPLAATTSPTPRGIARAGALDGALAGYGISSRSDDALEDGDFEAHLDAAETIAVELATRMRSGDVDRDPLGDECPRYCEFASICRRERSTRIESAAEAEAAAEEAE